MFHIYDIDNVLDDNVSIVHSNHKMVLLNRKRSMYKKDRNNVVVDNVSVIQ